MQERKATSRISGDVLILFITIARVRKNSGVFEVVLVRVVAGPLGPLPKALSCQHRYHMEGSNFEVVVVKLIFCLPPKGPHPRAELTDISASENARLCSKIEDPVSEVATCRPWTAHEIVSTN